jgi:two-component system, NtrC family, nitrogen regulation sensor histidine kinase NtrY
VARKRAAVTIRLRTFRTRLLLIFTAGVVASVGLVEWLVARATRQAFERVETQNVNALVAQFRREFARRGEEVVRAVNSLAASDTVLNVAIASDYAPFYGEASALAAGDRLDLLELVAGDGTIISSAEWPARFGYKEEWLAGTSNWKARGPFLRREELPDGVTLALSAVAEVNAGDRQLYVTGGQRLDREFLSSLVLPEGMRALLYRNFPAASAPELLAASGVVSQPGPLLPIIDQIRHNTSEITETVGNGSAAEIIHAIPLTGPRHELLGALLIGSSRREMVAVESVLLKTGLIVAGAGILVGIVLAWWAAARVTRPVRALAATAQKVAAGNWSATVEIPSHDEIGQLAQAFNRMTSELVAQRERLVQAERVAAWRELARRLAHELRNPLFPLQLTIENMRRAHQMAGGAGLRPAREVQNAKASGAAPGSAHAIDAGIQFEEVFREGTATLLAELANLKQIIARFSDFARMPAPEMKALDLNGVVRETVKLFEPQLAQTQIHCQTALDPQLAPIPADREQIARVLRNLILNAIDAMPEGGALTIATTARTGSVRLEVSDNGQGLTPEECERLFTPYYTTKQHGTGLGLAIVQSVVSDHNGRISVESQPGKGTSFLIDLPAPDLAKST